MRKKGEHLALADVMRIILDPDPFMKIAERYGVSYATVSACKNGKTRKARRALDKLEMDGRTLPGWNRKRGKRRFTDPEIVAIRTSGKPSGVLAERLGVAASTIRMIRCFQTYKDVST